MRKVIAATNMTIDGYCHHTYGVPDADLHKHYTELLQSAGAILYGRKTYELKQFWQDVLKDPSQEPHMLDFAKASTGCRRSFLQQPW